LLDEVPIQLTESSKGVVFVLGESGKGYLFTDYIKTKTSPKKGGRRRAPRVLPVTPVTILKFTTASGTTIPILTANFPALQDRLDLAYGNELKPRCEQIQFTDANGEMIPYLNLDREVMSLMSSDQTASFETVSSYHF
jgi:hypothetical protein